jgi:hypothetical protein
VTVVVPLLLSVIRTIIVTRRAVVTVTVCILYRDKLSLLQGRWINTDMGDCYKSETMISSNFCKSVTDEDFSNCVKAVFGTGVSLD